MKKIILLLTLTICWPVMSEVYHSDKLVVIAGSIRQDAYDHTKWCWIVDPEHTPVGVDPNLCHTASNGRIVIDYGVTYKKVVTFIVNADETYVSNLDLNVGVSAGLALSILELTSFGNKINPAEDLGYRKGNIWIYAIMEK